jgi:hypothetical protein
VDNGNIAIMIMNIYIQFSTSTMVTGLESLQRIKIALSQFNDTGAYYDLVLRST